ncbi:hypothetical protein VTK56DRAFT_3586 [Thermocarpiscus australiensis]
MAPKVDPIMLFGFCFVTQQRQDFNNSWACAFLTSWYTDEQHPMWDSLDDTDKRREIRYGNNIFVLFRALLHCKRFYGQDSLWPAIARGFNTSQTVVKATVNILTEARRVQRHKQARDVSDTARAADDWIDFLDSQETYPRMLSDPEVYKVADAFFMSLEKKILNAARVPLDRRSSMHITNTYRPLPNGRVEEANPSPHLPPTTSVKSERVGSPRDATERNRLPPSTRKRSASPSSSDPSSKSRRLIEHANGQSRPASDAQGEQGKTQRSQPPSPRRPSHPQSAASGAEAARPTGEVRVPSCPAIDEERSALRARIASLEKELAATKSRLSDTAPAGASRQFSTEIGGLQKDLNTVTNAVTTMMDSMHYIVDNLSSLRDEISGLSKQQGELATALPQADKLDTLLRPIQTMADSVKVLGDEVSELKKQASGQQPAVALSAEHSNAELKGLLQEQNSRIDGLAREMASMQTRMVSSLPKQSPQTLRQAMAAAERDLKHHLAAVQSFYYQLDGRGANRSVTERTADFLATLQQSVHSAQVGQQSY